MYDITKTRMLLTMAVFAAVAAVFAGGGNARIPEEDGSGIGVEPVEGIAATIDPLASSRLTGLLRAAQTRDRESGALSGDVIQFSQASSRLVGLLRAAQTRDRESGALSGDVIQFSQASSRLAGLLRAAQTRDRESGALSG